MEPNKTNQTIAADNPNKPFADGSHRLPNGRFGPGNSGGPGNPHAGRTSRLRSRLLDSVTDDDLADIAAKLVAMAKTGDLPAIKELLDRILGKPAQADLLQRIETLEAILSDRIEAASQ